MSHPRAGQPALPEELVDVDALLRAYDDIRPDPSDPAQRVAFGTSGHRGSAFKGAFNEAHILATTEAIVRYRERQGYTGPLFIGRDPHALSEPAWRTALDRALQAVAASGATALVVPMGLDTFEGDPISGFTLRSGDYTGIGAALADAQLPTVFTFEGGYAVAEVGTNAVNLLEGFARAA